MTRTLVGTLKGEPTYMAPEQARGSCVDRRSDLFSLGVMLFELFAGKHPWSAATDYEMVHMVATQPPADLRELRPKIDKELVSIVMRCLEKDPAARFQSADEVHARLDSWLRGHGYLEGSEEALGRFVRRNAMRQMRWFERAVAGNLAGPAEATRGGMTALTGPQASVSVDRSSTTSPEGSAARGAGHRALGDDATDFEGKPSSFFVAPDVSPIREAETVDEHSNCEERPSSDVGDEMPTIIKGDLRALVNLEISKASAAGNVVAGAPSTGPSGVPGDEPGAGSNSARGRSRGPQPSYYSIVEDDSDQRTTSVKPPLRTGNLVAARPPAMRTGQPPAAAEVESEELPTFPLNPPSGDAGASAQNRSAGGEQAQGGAVALLPGASAGSSLDAGPRPGAPKASGALTEVTQLQSRSFHLPPAAQPPVFEGRGRGQQSTEILAATGALQGYDRPPGGEHERDAERAAQDTATVEERLQAEASRLTAAAIRLREEARVAVAQAERTVAMASVAAHLASMAAESLRIAASSGPVKASRHLDEALTLEQALHRAAAAPLSLPPDAGVGPIATGHEQEQLLAQLGLAHLASPSMLAAAAAPPRRSSRPPPPRAAHGGPSSVGGAGYPRPGPPGPTGFSPSGNQRQLVTAVPGATPIPDFSGASGMGTVPLPPLDPVAAGYGRPYPQQEGTPGAGYAIRHPAYDTAGPPSAAAMLPGQVMAPASAVSTGVGNTNLDTLRFRASVRPMLIGVPRMFALAVAAGAFLVVLMLLWIFLS
jgi:eukaryotic-like serine/threonine-protein kinase